MRYALVGLLLLTGCASTADILARHQATCERMGLVGKDATECALRIYETHSGVNTVRVTK